MTEDYVTYEQAKKLKEVGFGEETRYGYYKMPNGTPQMSKWDICLESSLDYPSLKFYKSPTLAQVQKWLRGKEIFLFISNDNDAEVNGRTQFHWWITDKLGRPFLYGEGDDAKLLRCESYYDTYEQALSAGIDKVIEILKEENNGK